MDINRKSVLNGFVFLIIIMIAAGVTGFSDRSVSAQEKATKSDFLSVWVLDPKAAGNEFWQIRNQVTNRSDADRILRRWATLLNDHLARVKS